MTSRALHRGGLKHTQSFFFASLFQSPEIAQIRRHNQPLLRVSGRALRRSGSTLSPEPTREQSKASSSTSSTSRSQTPIKRDAGPNLVIVVGDDENEADKGIRESDTGGNPGINIPTETRRGRTGRATSGRGNDAGDIETSVASPLWHGSADRCGEDVSVSGDASEDRSPTVTPSTSDIWAWALIVLQMFSDEMWAPDSGQVSAVNLDCICRTRKGTIINKGIGSGVHSSANIYRNKRRAHGLQLFAGMFVFKRVGFD